RQLFCRGTLHYVLFGTIVFAAFRRRRRLLQLDRHHVGRSDHPTPMFFHRSPGDSEGMPTGTPTTCRPTNSPARDIEVPEPEGVRADERPGSTRHATLG